MDVTILTAGAAAAALVLLVVTARTWLDFTRRSDLLAASITQYRELIAEHSTRLEQVRARATEVAERTETTVEECDGLERDVESAQEELAQLEESMERVRPKHRRVDLRGME